MLVSLLILFSASLVIIALFHRLHLPPVLTEVIMEKRGLILMVGATGSGKSTTLASMLELRNQRMTGHILTIEDPLEFLFSNKKSIVNQREVGRDTHSLQVGLKNALRQAPDQRERHVVQHPHHLLGQPDAFVRIDGFHATLAAGCDKGQVLGRR